MPPPAKRHWRRPLFLITDRVELDQREWVSACGHVNEDTPGVHFVTDRRDATARSS